MFLTLTRIAIRLEGKELFFDSPEGIDWLNDYCTRWKQIFSHWIVLFDNSEVAFNDFRCWLLCDDTLSQEAECIVKSCLIDDRVELKKIKSFEWVKCLKEELAKGRFVEGDWQIRLDADDFLSLNALKYLSNSDNDLVLFERGASLRTSQSAVVESYEIFKYGSPFIALRCKLGSELSVYDYEHDSWHKSNTSLVHCRDFIGWVQIVHGANVANVVGGKGWLVYHSQILTHNEMIKALPFLGEVYSLGFSNPTFLKRMTSNFRRLLAPFVRLFIVLKHEKK